LFFISLILSGGDFVYSASEINSSAKKATVTLKNHTLEEAYCVRKLIEENGGRVLVFQLPNILRIKAGPSITAILKDNPLVEKVEFDRTARGEVSSAAVKGTRYLEPYFSGDDIKIPEYRKMSKRQLEDNAERYRRRWKRNKYVIRRNFLERHGLMYSPADEGAGSSEISAARGVTPEGKPEASGKAGASYYETSLYLAGDIAVGVFFEPGLFPQWTNSAADIAYSRIVNALEAFAEDLPDAHISFTFVKEVEEDGSFIPCPSGIMEETDYVNDLRSVYNTHWAYIIKAVNGGLRAHAYLWGPSMEIYDDNINADGGAIRHETCHIFGAADQYTDTTVKPPPTSRYGYLNVVNANSHYNNGGGYFDGAGEGQRDIMVGTQRIYGLYTRGQLGVWDSDGDGIIDPIDTYAEILLNGPVLLSGAQGGKIVKFSGKAIDMPLINERSDYFIGSVTLNTIKTVEYRINGSRWISAASLDGSFDGKEEKFGFVSPELPNGEYLFEVRAINSVGNIGPAYAGKKIVIDNAPEDNAAAVVGFSVTPQEGSVRTVFKFDASGTIHLKDGAALAVRWDFDNDGTADTQWMPAGKIYSKVFYNPGKKEVRLEAQDKQGRVFALVKEVVVQKDNLPPKAYFTATPAHFHGSYTGGYPVTFDAQGTIDAEDDSDALLLRWRFAEDGQWSEWESFQQAEKVNYIYVLGEKSQLWRVSLEVKDSQGTVSSASRDVWAIPYNTQPCMMGFDGQVRDGAIVLSNYNALDQDSITPWDGLLEYRWDIESDGIWDTKYSASKEALRFALPKDKDTIRVTCEARDRFGATSQLTKLFFINEEGVYIVPVPAQRIGRGEHLILTIKAIGKEDDEIELDAQLFDGNGEDTFLDSGKVTLDEDVPGRLGFYWTPFTSGVYTVRVSARVNGKESQAKEEFTITVVNNNNQAAAVKSPADGERIKPGALTFILERPDAVKEYFLKFGTTPQAYNMNFVIRSLDYDRCVVEVPRNFAEGQEVYISLFSVFQDGTQKKAVYRYYIQLPPNTPPVLILRDLNNPSGEPADDCGGGLNGRRVYNNTALKLKDNKVMLWIRMEDDRPFVKKVFLPFCKGARELTLKYLGGGWNSAKRLWCGEWVLSGEITKTASFTVSVTDGEFTTPPVWLYFPGPGQDRDPTVKVTAETPLNKLKPGAQVKITVAISDDNVVPGDAIFFDRQTKARMALLRLTYRLVIKEDTYKTWEIYSLPGGIPEGADKNTVYTLYFGARDLRGPQPIVHGESAITLE